MKSIESLLNKNEWDKIEWENLTLSDFKAQDKNGDTILHKATRLERLESIPKKFIRHELLKIKNKDGNSVYFLAASSIEADLIPEELLTREVLLERNAKGETTLLSIIKNEETQRIAKKLIYSGILLERCESMGTTYLHICAASGELKKLPKEYYVKRLALQDENKDTLLHKLAEEDRLWEIPEENRDPALVEITNSYNQNPLHKVVNLEDVPKEFLTPKSLEAQDWKGQTPVYRSTWINGIEHLPTECLTEKALTTPTHDGQTPLSNILSDYDGKYTEKYLKILRHVSRKTLEKLTSGDTTSKAKSLVMLALKAHNFKEKIMLKSNDKTLKIDI